MEKYILQWEILEFEACEWGQYFWHEGGQKAVWPGITDPCA